MFDDAFCWQSDGETTVNEFVCNFTGIIENLTKDGDEFCK